MAEWLILLILVPAIVVPAVLLLGFAGCGFTIEFEPDPIIVSAVAESDTEITLTWIYDDGDMTTNRAQFTRTKRGETTSTTFDAFGSPDTDRTLVRATLYDYQMRGYGPSGLGTKVSPVVSARTDDFRTLWIDQDKSFGNVNNKTVKCELGRPGFLPPPFAPTRMWITLGQRAGASQPITFSKVYIGQKAATGDPWDAVSLTPVLFNGSPSTTILPPNPNVPNNPLRPGKIRSDEIAFAWDRSSALILSMYFAGGDGEDELSAATTGASWTYLKNDVDEAAIPVPDPPDYQTFDGYLSGVIKIEMA